MPTKEAQAKVGFRKPRISHGLVLFDRQRANFDHWYGSWMGNVEGATGNLIVFWHKLVFL